MHLNGYSRFEVVRFPRANRSARQVSNAERDPATVTPCPERAIRNLMRSASASATNRPQASNRLRGPS
jgi:hypothetical protein